MLIGNRIKQARIKMNMSQQELGNQLGVSKVSVCGYETGTRTPTLETLIRLSDLLGLEPNYILGCDITVVSESEVSYQMTLSTTDLDIIKELKKHRALYNQLCDNPEKEITKWNRLMK